MKSLHIMHYNQYSTGNVTVPVVFYVSEELMADTYYTNDDIAKLLVPDLTHAVGEFRQKWRDGEDAA